MNWKFSGPSVPTGAEIALGFENQPDAPLATVAGDLIAVIVASDVANFIDNECELSSVLVKLGPTTTGPSIEVPGGISGDGGGIGTLPNAAFLVKKATAVGGRQGRGRIYWPFVLSSWRTDDGQMTSAIVAAFTNFWNELNAELTTAGYPLVLLHSVSSPPMDPTPVELLVAQTTAATQRRRLRR